MKEQTIERIEDSPKKEIGTSSILPQTLQSPFQSKQMNCSSVFSGAIPIMTFSM